MLGALFFMASCGGEKPAETETTHEEHSDHDGHDHGDTEETQAEPSTYVVDTEASNIRWEGTAVGVYSHFGNIAIQDGNITVEGNAITAGSFTIDMTSIDPQDENYSPEGPKEKLVGHLGSGDFFDIENNPTATFEITSVEGDQMTGNLTLRGHTDEEVLTINQLEIAEDGKMTASATVSFDRQKYGAAYSFATDMVLADDIDLQIRIVASK